MPTISCQSCGIPLKNDAKGGGTNYDGSRSDRFCSHCYKDGRFIQPDISLPEMKNHVTVKMTEMGVPKFLSGMVTLNLHKLDRWKG